jgi:alkaline phosphatase
MRYKRFLFPLLFFILSNSLAQENIKIYKLHSHNDYLQDVPFWIAYANKLESIEADVILMDNELYVAHEKESIQKDRTLVSLYLDPIRKAFELNLGPPRTFQLLIDIKTEPYTTLKKLEEVLKDFGDILTGNHAKVNIVISGNRPLPDEYGNYPHYMQFDYQSITAVSDLPLDKIALVSLNFNKLSTWKGNDKMMRQEEEELKKAIEIAHSLNKPIRFWATPDTQKAWKTLLDLGVDYINTDKPFEARHYLETVLKE